MSVERSTLVLYLAAAVAYVTLGVFFPRVLFSWVEGAGFLLFAVWVLPALGAFLWRKR